MSKEELDLIIEQINSSDAPVLIHRELLGGHHFYVLKRVGTVVIEKSRYSGLKGIEIQLDSDWSEYSLRFFKELYLSGFPVNESTKYTIAFGRKDIENHLRQINHWEYGINFREKLGKLLDVIDIYCNNELIPHPSL